MDNDLQTLFLPLENGDVRMEGRVLFMGAQSHPMLSALDVDVWQVWNPLAAPLSASPDLPDGPYAHVLVLLPKQVDEAKYWIALALDRLHTGGTLLAAAANDAGGNRIEKWFAEAGLTPQSHSKNKARAVWAQKPSTLSPILQDWMNAGYVQDIEFGDALSLKSQPGVFSWDRLDEGSRLLTAHLPANIGGNVADFGSGIGYLSHYLLSNRSGIGNLHLLEADARALACSRQNLADVQGKSTLHFHWADLTAPVQGLPPLDFIVMNPPFHTGKKTDAVLGQRFIATASHHLKKRGELWMVANAHLPYEKLLAEKFQNVTCVIQEYGYKIIRAIK